MPDGSGDDLSSVDDAGASAEAGDAGGPGPDTTNDLDAGSDVSSRADASEGASTSCNSLTVSSPSAVWANPDAGFPTPAGGTVVTGTYKLTAINGYGDTGTFATGMTATMTMVLTQGDAGQSFLGEIAYDQTGGGFTASMSVTFASNQYEATYSCVDPLDSSFGLVVTPLGYDGNPVTYTYDAASTTLHLYNAYGTGYGTPGNPRMYEDVLVLQ
jgi:hypothetical protein